MAESLGMIRLFISEKKLRLLAAWSALTGAGATAQIRRRDAGLGPADCTDCGPQETTKGGCRKKKMEAEEALSFDPFHCIFINTVRVFPRSGSQGLPERGPSGKKRRKGILYRPRRPANAHVGRGAVSE